MFAAVLIMQKKVMEHFKMEEVSLGTSMHNTCILSIQSYTSGGFSKFTAWLKQFKGNCLFKCFINVGYESGAYIQNGSNILRQKHIKPYMLSI